MYFVFNSGMICMQLYVVSSDVDLSCQSAQVITVRGLTFFANPGTHSNCTNSLILIAQKERWQNIAKLAYEED